MADLRLDLGDLVIRPWARDDEPALVRHGNDREVARYLANRFPSPYTTEDAAAWFEHCASLEDPIAALALVVEGEPCGGIGVERQSDLGSLTGEVGYWLGRRFWGRGLVTRALVALSEVALTDRDFERLEAQIFEPHAASARVLEKAGYRLEGRRRRALFKHGELHDGLVYVRFRQPE